MGRDRIVLGVPPSSSVGDVVGTLLTLYPQLTRLVSDDRDASAAGLQLFLEDRFLHDLGAVLTEGSRLYLVAVLPRPASPAIPG